MPSEEKQHHVGMDMKVVKRPPLEDRQALRREASRYLRRLARKEEPTPSHLPISPEFEQAMISVIAQREQFPEYAGWSTSLKYKQDLVGVLLSHQYLSQKTLRWITQDFNNFWRTHHARKVVTHPACTALEAAVAAQAGWGHPHLPNIDDILDARWEGREGWKNIVNLWNATNARDIQAFYRFGDEVQAQDQNVQEVFVRLAADAHPDLPGQRDRRRAWEMYRISQSI